MRTGRDVRVRTERGVKVRTGKGVIVRTGRGIVCGEWCVRMWYKREHEVQE